MRYEDFTCNKVSFLTGCKLTIKNENPHHSPTAKHEGGSFSEGKTNGIVLFVGKPQPTVRPAGAFPCFFYLSTYGKKPKPAPINGPTSRTAQGREDGKAGGNFGVLTTTKSAHAMKRNERSGRTYCIKRLRIRQRHRLGLLVPPQAQRAATLLQHGGCSLLRIQKSGILSAFLAAFCLARSALHFLADFLLDGLLRTVHLLNLARIEEFLELFVIFLTDVEYTA